MQKLESMLDEEKEIEKLLEAGRDNDPVEISRIKGEAEKCKAAGVLGGIELMTSLVFKFFSNLIVIILKSQPKDGLIMCLL